MKMFSMIFKIFRIDQNIVDKNHNKFIEFWHEDTVHEIHEICRCIVSGFIRLPTVGYTQGGRFCVGMRRDQELEGADNTRFRQVQAAICVMPYVLYNGLYCLDVDLVILCFEGVPARPYISGGTGLHES
jgi:hypothetical protein